MRSGKGLTQPPPQALRFSHGRGERETMTGDEPQGTMGRVLRARFKERRLGTRQGLTSSNKDNRANFSGEKSTMKHSGVSNFLQYAKNFKSNLVVVVLLVFESKGK